MNDKPQSLAPAAPDLAAAVRQARLENAERAEARADLRELEMARLAALESALKPVVDQTPAEADMFDLAIAPGDHPRLFLDMIAFIDMAHDKRTYRFFQDTRHGRVLIAESQSTDKIAAAAASYVARRLVERERALAADTRAAERKGPRAWSIAPPSPREPDGRDVDGETVRESVAPWRPRRRFARLLGDALSFFLMVLGSIALALLIGLGVYLAWTLRLHSAWAHWIGAPPF